ncbi:MAG: histidine kinase [Bacteroidota bacterium]
MKTFIQNRFLQNILFWVAFAIVPFSINLGSFGNSANMYTDIQYYVECGVLGYFNTLVLMPLFLDRKKYTIYAVSILITIAALVTISSQVTTMISPLYKQSFTGHLYEAIDYLIFAIAFGSGYLIRSYIQQSERINKLEEEKLQTEVDFLKSQINPHLLFNTLNTIYSHSLEGSKDTPKMILKLSEMMRYMLYETNESKVPLQKELAYLSDYVNLQQFRIKGRGRVDFNLSGNPDHLKIAPMLLISFIENAFKHSMDSLSTDIYISVLLSVDANMLVLEVENNYEPLDSHSDFGGIGVQNVKKRLELIYPDQHQLDIVTSSDVYSVKLTLDL